MVNIEAYNFLSFKSGLLRRVWVMGLIDVNYLLLTSLDILKFLSATLNFHRVGECFLVSF